ncbi:MAG: ABC transporter permease [Bryobacteraceae bacterium]
MAIPLSYNLRNLVVRRTTTLMTALGIALTVAVLLAVLALVDGLRVTLATSGDPRHVLVMRKGGTSELTSLVTRAQFQDLKFHPGIATGSDGQPLASLELITLISLEAEGSGTGDNVTIRGVMPAGIAMRHNVKLIAGRWFRQGVNEAVVGKSLSDQYPAARIGKKLRMGRSDWQIVGVMDAAGGAQASEIWGDVNQVAADWNRSLYMSSALVEAPDAATAKVLVNSIGDDTRLDLGAELETDYFARQTQSAEPIEYTGIFVAIIMAIGSSFAAMNTMYAAVARRAREIGTLRVLGFSKLSILTSFWLESVLLAGLGGVIGCLLVLPLNGVTTEVGANFSQLAFAFHVTSESMVAGVVFAIALGSVGGLFPAAAAARKEILSALREI